MNVDALIDSIAKKAEPVRDLVDYEKDGLLYCGHCNTPKQCRIPIGGNVRLVGCQCACAAREYEAEKNARADREKRLRIETLRADGVRDKSLTACRFDRATMSDEIVKCKRYADAWDDMRRENSGLLLWGNTGNGKTFAAACIATADSAGGGGVSADDITPDFSYMDDISDRLKKIADAVLLIAAGLALWKVASGLPGALGSILTKLSGILIAVGGLILLWDGLSDAWNNGVNWKNLLESLAGVVALAGGLAIAFGKVGAGIGLVVSGAALIITAFKDIVTNGANLQNTLMLISGIVATGLGFFFLTGSVIPLVIAGIASVVTAALALTGNLTEFARNLKDNILGGIIQFIKGVFTGNWKSAWEGVKKVFSGIWNSIVIIAESAINAVIKGLNWLISKINTIKFTVPSWVPGVGGKSIGGHLSSRSEVKLPRLATGAVIPPNKEFLAVLGDQKSGTNIETPLATMVDAFKQAMAESGGGTTTVVVQLDGKEIARSTVKNINNMTRAAGKPVLLY